MEVKPVKYEGNRPIPINLWGRDHWSTFAYIEDCCVNATPERKGIGEIDNRRMRTDRERHPMQARPKSEIDASGKDYPTRLSNNIVVYDHDDWDCLEDMEEAGLVEIFSLVNGAVRMTLEGNRVAGLLRSHKTAGGSFANFQLPSN